MYEEPNSVVFVTRNFSLQLLGDLLWLIRSRNTLIGVVF